MNQKHHESTGKGPFLQYSREDFRDVFHDDFRDDFREDFKNQLNRPQDSHLVSHQSVRLDAPVAPGVAPLCGEGHEVVVVVPVSPSGALGLLARLFLEELASVAPFGAEVIHA